MKTTCYEQDFYAWTRHNAQLLWQVSWWKLMSSILLMNSKVWSKVNNMP
jgi:hypothetical protein